MPLVRETQLTAITWTRKRNATVMITNDGPLDRSGPRPGSTRPAAATTPATGTHNHGFVSGNLAASTPIV